MPFVSIIIPTYNRAHLITESINSVINQIFEDWELIIVDDGGSDNTKSIIENINDPRINYFWKENGERGSARNFGVKKARGKYVFFLDSDDILYKTHLQHAWLQLKRLKFPEFFHVRYEEVFPDKTKQVKALNKNSIWKTIKRQNQFACQFFLLKIIALAYPFNEDRRLSIGEDWLVILKVGMNYPLHFSNTVHAAIVQHNERSMEIVSPESILNSRNLILKELAGSDRSLQLNVFLELTSLAALNASLQNSKIQSLKLLMQTCLRSPFYIFNKKRTLATLKHIIIGK